MTASPVLKAGSAPSLPGAQSAQPRAPRAAPGTGAAPARAFVVPLFELSVGLQVSDPACASRLEELLTDLRGDEGGVGARQLRLCRQAGRAGGRHVLYDGQRVVAAGMDVDEAVAMVLWHLNQLAVTTAGYAVVHAGAVAAHGRGVVLAAPMEAGKSTLVTALVAAGWTYLSDEFAGLSLADHRLHPYPCPISLEPGSFSLFAHLRPPHASGDALRWHLRPDDVRPGSLSAAVPPAAVVFPRYRPGALCRLEPVGAADALVLLSNQALNLHSGGQRVFQALARLAAKIPAYRLVFGRLHDATASLDTLAGRWQR